MAGLKEHVYGTDSKKSGGKEYRVHKYYIKEDSDFDSSRCIELQPIKDLKWVLREHIDTGTILVPINSLGNKARFVGADKSVIVSSKTRDELLAQGFLHLTFRPTKPAQYSDVGPPEVLSWEHHSPQWWELWSDLTLPPLSPTMKHTDGNGNVVARDWKGWKWFSNPTEDDDRLHYLDSELKGVEPFDIAVTFEHQASPWQRYLVVSQKFYQFCKSKKWAADWEPVAIDVG